MKKSDLTFDSSVAAMLYCLSIIADWFGSKFYATPETELS